MKYLEKIDISGYLFLPNLISSGECDRYKSLLEKNYSDYSDKYASNHEIASHGLEDKSKEKVVYNLHNKDLSWYKLFEHPDVLTVLDYLFVDGSYKNSEPYYLNNISARCPLKGNSGQQLHLDSRMPGVSPCVVANVIWLLDDFTEENGATRIVPGSHKFKRFAEDGKFDDEEILLTGKKGGALIFNANIWHGGGPNTNGESRWALALGYARWFVKPSFDYMQNTPREIYKQLTLSQKKLLGFDLIPPKDEFSRVRRRSSSPEQPVDYKLPDLKKE